MSLVAILILMSSSVLTIPIYEHIRVRKLRRSYDNYHLQTFEPIYDETLRRALCPQGHIIC